MDPNPSAILKAALEAEVFPLEPVLMEHSYYFAKTPPPCVNIDLEPHLRYIKYEVFEGKYEFATIQEFQNHEDAYRHWETQKKYDANFLIHPRKCVMRQDKYVLIFPKIIRDFNGCWVNKHANGDANSRVTDADMWKILKKIGKNMKYLSSEATSHRPHGNLLEGIGITSDLEALFLNLGNGTDPMLYGDDVRALHGLFTSIVPSLRDLAIRTLVEKWMTFLSDSCLQVTADSRPAQRSAIHPLYQNHNHVRLIFNYPSSWSSVREELRFLENMYTLCMGTRCRFDSANLLNNASFRAHLVKCHYTHWNNCFISGKNKTALNEVYQYREPTYLDQSGRMIIVPTIVLFAHNCIKHYNESARRYNNANNYRCGHPLYMVDYLTESEILAEINREFPHLIENIYRAFYKAVAGGYKHPAFSVEQILT